MPTILRVGGHRFFFFSNEGSEPPYIHVEKAENYAKFWLEPIALARSIGYNAKELRELRELTEEHKNLFVKRWYEYFSD
jgi:hypothetical protein